MRRMAFALLAALLLAVPLAAADATPPSPRQRVCTSFGCAQTDDQDRDGHADWANVALAAAQLVFLNLNANRTNVTYAVGFTAEEYEPLHGPDDKALGADAWGYGNLTARDGRPGFNDTEANVLVYQLDHETGEYETLREETLYVGDSNRDGRPDRFHPCLLP